MYRPDHHMHGWARRKDGTFACRQDYYAVGKAPETGCGAVFDPASLPLSDKREGRGGAALTVEQGHSLPQ